LPGIGVTLPLDNIAPNTIVKTMETVVTTMLDGLVVGQVSNNVVTVFHYIVTSFPFLDTMAYLARNVIYVCLSDISFFFLLCSLKLGKIFSLTKKYRCYYMIQTAKIIETGLATTGLIGAGLIGAVFGALILVVVRNPFLTGQLFSYYHTWPKPANISNGSLCLLTLGIGIALALKQT